MVQPFFESLVVFAWCFMSGVLPYTPAEKPAPEQVANNAAVKVFDELAEGVLLSNSAKYLNQFGEELRGEHKKSVEAVLNNPRNRRLEMKYKLEPVSVGSYEATYRAKILTYSVCSNCDYQANIEYATVTIMPAQESETVRDGRFFSEPSKDPADERWEITRWETEKVVPYDGKNDG